MSSSVQREGADVAAGVAGEQPLFDTKHAKGRVRSAAGAADAGAAAGIAAEATVMTLRQRCQLAFKFPNAVFALEKGRIQLLVLRLKLVVAAFLLGCLGFDKAQMLSKERRRAVFVDELLKRRYQLIKESHG